MLTCECPSIPNATDRIGGDLNVSMSHQSQLQRVASCSFQSTIYTGPTGGHIHAGSDKSAAHERTWVFQKAYRQLHNDELLITQNRKYSNVEIFDTLPFKVIFIFPIAMHFFLYKNWVKWA